MPMSPPTHRLPGQLSPAEAARDYDRRRGSAAQRLYDSKWRLERAAFLQQHRHCVMCLIEGVRTAATVVDHKIPHRGDQTLFWDKTNWQPLCAEHHSSDKQSLEKRSNR